MWIAILIALGFGLISLGAAYIKLRKKFKRLSNQVDAETPQLVEQDINLGNQPHVRLDHPSGTSDPSENHLENLSIMSWLPDAIIILDYSNRLVWANRSATKWFGLTLEEHRETNIAFQINHTQFTEFLTTKDPHESMDMAAPSSAETIIRLRVMPYRNQQLLLQARDVTQVKHLEQVRRDFVANASHELRTPISILYGYLEMMMNPDEKGINQEWKPAIQQMHDQTIRVKQIIDDMMTLSRIEEPDSTEEHQHIEMAPLLESAHKNAIVLSGSKSHHVSIDIQTDYTLLCNQKEIESLIANLISNAVRYTPDNGQIDIQWKVDSLGGTLSVSDTGMGIDSADIPRLTERFYRTDTVRSRESGGTGLGLAIANHIINRHQGSLEILSELDHGSQFIVHFPADRLRNTPGQVDLLLH